MSEQANWAAKELMDSLWEGGEVAQLAAALEAAERRGYREGVEYAAQIVGAPWEHLLTAHLLSKEASDD